MEHVMKLNDASFLELNEGKKKHEYRINDEKRQLIKLGDTIKFLKLSNNDEFITTRVEGLLYYLNWRSSYEDFWNELKDKYDSIDQAVEETYSKWYKKEEEQKYGVVLIKIKKI